MAGPSQRSTDDVVKGLCAEDWERLVRERFSDRSLRDVAGKPDADGEFLRCLRFSVFKVLVGETSLSWLPFERLRELDPARAPSTMNGFLLEFWYDLSCDWGKPEQREQAHDWLRRVTFSVDYLRAHLFELFLNELDAVSARRVYCGTRGPRSLAAYVHWLGLVGVSVLVMAFSNAPVTGVVRARSPLGAGGWILVLYGMLLLLQMWAFKTAPLAAAVNSLLPRLAATSVVGLLFLVSARDFVAFLVRTGTSPWPVVAACTLISCVYVMVVLLRYMHPVPRARELCFRSVNILATALMHSAAIVLVAGPYIVNGFKTARPRPLAASEDLVLSMIVLTIGLVANVIWQEQPVTRPL